MGSVKFWITNITLFRNKRFALNKMFQRNASKGQQRLFSLALCKVQNFCVWTYPNSYILIGCKMKSYLANNKKIWPLGLYEGHKAKKGQKTKWLRIVQFGEKSNKNFFTEQKSHKNLENFCLNGITSLLLWRNIKNFFLRLTKLTLMYQ